MSKKYVKHLSNNELLKRMADELIDMHKQTAIDLAYWETAFEIVERFYFTNVSIEFKGEKDDILPTV